MAKIGILLPRQTILEHAKRVVSEQDIQQQVKLVKVIHDNEAQEEAKLAVAGGIEIIIARGFQAFSIKKAVSIPVIDMPLTTQEIGMVILKAKKQLNKEMPRIAIIGWQNMFPNMEDFQALFQIDLRVYYLHHMEDQEKVVEHAIAEGAEIIIGGIRTNQIAFERNFPALFLEGKKDSVREAFLVARQVGAVIDLEKQNNAQLETIFDTSFNGIVKLNAFLEVVSINRYMEEILKKSSREAAGFSVEKILPGVSRTKITSLLDGSLEMYSTSVMFGQHLFMVLGAPIRLDAERIIGVILTCRRILQMDKAEAQKKQESYAKGYIAKRDFNCILRKSPLMCQCIEQAKVYALSEKPILICGETGTEKEILAECIHNNSNSRGGAYVHVNCSALPLEEQKALLFGREEVTGRQKPEGKWNRGMVAEAWNGTIFLEDVEYLSMEVQYLLYKAARERLYFSENSWTKEKNPVRIIASTAKELLLLVKEEKFRADLYSLFSSWRLDIPAVRENTKDLVELAKYYIQKYSLKYSRPIKADTEVCRALTEYSWEGNLVQLEDFCEKLVLFNHRKNLEAGFIRTLLLETYSDICVQNGKEKIVMVKHPEAVKIARLMEINGGNRAKTAKDLGISTTTLWRRIKKYGILQNYEIEQNDEI